MAEENIKVDDYASFDSAVATVNTVGQAIEAADTKIKSAGNTLSSETVFMGPISDSCQEGFQVLNKRNAQLIENMNAVSSYLSKAKTNYQGADANAKELYLSIKDGKLVETEAAPYVDTTHPQYQVDFINKVLPGALLSYQKYGVLPSITLAQAAKETGFGKATVGNNIFGIKAGSGWTGKTINAETGEQRADGSRYRINADFRDYDSVEDSIEDHAKVLSQDRYKAVIEAKDYKEAAHAVKDGGYATSITYADSLINDYIEPYHLDQWDPKK